MAQMLPINPAIFIKGINPYSGEVYADITRTFPQCLIIRRNNKVINQVPFGIPKTGNNIPIFRSPRLTFPHLGGNLKNTDVIEIIDTSRNVIVSASTPLYIVNNLPKLPIQIKSINIINGELTYTVNNNVSFPTITNPVIYIVDNNTFTRVVDPIPMTDVTITPNFQVIDIPESEYVFQSDYFIRPDTVELTNNFRIFIATSTNDSAISNVFLV